MKMIYMIIAFTFSTRKRERKGKIDLHLYTTIRGVLDEILNLIESVSEGFPSYSYNIIINRVENLHFPFAF